MNLFIIGATGRTGQLVTAQALERGHSVTALVRTPSLQRRERLNVIVGDPRRQEDLLAAMPDHDAVISCVGHKGGNDPRLVTEVASATLAAMELLGMRRYVILSGGLLFPTFNPAALLLRLLLATRLADARAMEKLVFGSNVDWTIVRPPHLKGGIAAKGYQTKVGGPPSNGWAGLQFTDLAACLLDTVEGERNIQQIIGVTSASR
jgi:putative NADH-flavin reductase